LVVGFSLGGATNSTSTSLSFGVDSPVANPTSPLSHTYNSAGSYTATYSCVGAGGNDSRTIPITVNAPPTLSCSISPLAGLSPLVVRVVAGGTGLGTTTFDFNMDDGTPLLTGKPATTYYTYSNPGTYHVTVSNSVYNAYRGASSPVTCSTSVTVNDPSTSDGGETRP
jgi:PKD repeat protein